MGAVVATLGAAGVLGAMVIRGRTPRRSEAAKIVAQARPVQPEPNIARAVPSTQANLAVSAVQPLARTPNVSAGNVAVAPTAARPSAYASRALAPVLPEGRTDLPDGISAMRTDSIVVLSFDTKLARTRIPEKFERFVRATLPAIYGASADSALARIPAGELARQGDLIGDLPSRGMRIPVPSGGIITLFPMTRPGQDGPLVTRYRVLVVKG